MSLSREDAARGMGMKPSEVLEVQAAPDGQGFHVTTHDGAVSLVDRYGGFLRLVSTRARVAVDVEGVGQVVEGADEVEAKLRAEAAEQVAKSVQHVLAWVDKDPTRARYALDAERARRGDDVRSSLVGPLEALATVDTEGEEEGDPED